MTGSKARDDATDGAVYLDYNASTPMRPAVIDAIEAASQSWGNPSSVHRFGREARHIIEQARGPVAALAGAEPEGVIFTSGATEANNLALHGWGRVMVSAVEHVSVLDAAPDAEIIPVDGDGVIDLGALETMLGSMAAGGSEAATTLVSVMLANNETGAIQPIGAAAALAHRFGARLHCDAVQGAGKIPLAMGEMGIDLLSLSAHKIGGPKGVGALIIGDGVTVTPLIRGGGQERGRRGGTENVAAIAGFSAACAQASEDVATPGHGQRIQCLRDGFEDRVRAITGQAKVFGAGSSRLGNTSCIAMPGVPSETQVMDFDLGGIAVSAGAACSSGKVAPSHVLAAMGVPDHEASAAIRVSLGWNSTEGDIDCLAEAWGKLYARTRATAPAPAA